MIEVLLEVVIRVFRLGPDPRPCTTITGSVRFTPKSGRAASPLNKSALCQQRTS